jgi:Fe-S-cluster containining protein
MKLETSIRRIKKLAKKRDDENWRFRSFLKSIDLSIEELDAIVHRHYETVSKQIDCCECGNCCREVLPSLSQTDIQRLASTLNLSVDAAISTYLKPSEKNTFTFKKRPCPFLSDNKCTVYESRPDDCRSYPHLQKNEFVFRLIGVVSNCSVCPIVFHVFERLKDELWHTSDEL